LELTAAASWLNTAFAGYDRMILSLLHSVANGFFTFLFKLITLLGEKGILFFLAAIILMCFPKTRKLGVCIFGAVCCGALITNVILKDAVARPRPLTVLPYSQWWAEIKAPAEDGWSFPSGHVTAAAAGMVAIRLMRGKRWTVPAIVWILLMMIARNYLMAHYPTDVLAAAIIGVASAFISYYITYFIFQFIYINRKKKWCGLVLTWSAPDYYGIPSRLKLTGEADEKEFTFLRKPSSGEKQDPGAPEGEAPKQKKWQLPNITLPGKKSNSDYQGKHVK
jgi:Membrane-associated phospholipid phosphatase